MELNIYDIITGVVVTSKSVKTHKQEGKITFWINKLANKIVVKQAVEKIWDVKVGAVRIINVSGKKRSFARKGYITADRKKAIITLKKGYKIDVPGMYENIGAQSAEVAPVSEEGK